MNKSNCSIARLSFFNPRSLQMKQVQIAYCNSADSRMILAAKLRAEAIMFPHGFFLFPDRFREPATA